MGLAGSAGAVVSGADEVAGLSFGAAAGGVRARSLFAGAPGGEADGAAGAASLSEGRGGSSGMAGTPGMSPLSRGPSALADALVFSAGAVAAALAAGVEGVVCGQAAGALSEASEVPFTPLIGGTPSGDWLATFAAACDGGGPSLIFTYKYAPTPARIVIVMSGRIEPMDRPP